MREELLLFTCVIHALQISTKYGVEPPSLETYTQPRPDEALVNIAPALRHTMHGRGAGGVGELIHPDLPAVGHDGALHNDADDIPEPDDVEDPHDHYVAV